MAYVELQSGMVIETSNPAFWPEAKPLSKKDGERRMYEEAKARLLEILQPDDSVYTVLRHVSRSGMFRRIDLYKMTDKGPQYLSGYAARVLGKSLHKDGGIGVTGCGMDMGFELVYRLGRRLWSDGFGVVGNDDGGYALTHRWL